jgi:PHP family Zn ribbon phosphoesterase
LEGQKQQCQKQYQHLQVYQQHPEIVRALVAMPSTSGMSAIEEMLVQYSNTSEACKSREVTNSSVEITNLYTITKNLQRGPMFIEAFTACKQC